MATSSSRSARGRCSRSSTDACPDRALCSFMPMTAYDRGNPESFTLEPQSRRINKPWGYEILLSPPDAPYTSKLIQVNAGKRLSLQVHDTKVETQTLVAGRGVLVLEGPGGDLPDIGR